MEDYHAGSSYKMDKSWLESDVYGQQQCADSLWPSVYVQLALGG